MNKTGASCDYNSVQERDMDVLFLEMIASDSNFAQLILDKTDLSGQPCIVEKVELSKTDSKLGESDITVTLGINGKRYGLLIEDKIDASAMKEQPQRYYARGDKGIKNGLYDDYRVLIFCPQKYLRNNKEAKEYQYNFTYEECCKYLEEKDDANSRIRVQLVKQAIKKAKKPSSTTLNETANKFLKDYIEYYNSKHFENLDLRTNKDANGYWVTYKPRFGTSHIYHKLQEGYVDLTFYHASSKLSVVDSMVSWLRDHGMENVSREKTGDSASLRIRVPKLKMNEAFSNTSERDLEKCFNAINELNDLANFLENGFDVRNVKQSAK